MNKKHPPEELNSISREELERSIIIREENIFFISNIMRFLFNRM